MRGLLSADGIRQFLSYFGVGGIAALIEWAVFFLLEYAFSMPYLLATVLAFVVSTTVNWILGRTFTFKGSVYQNKKIKELFLVFVVSAAGLLLNLLLMYLFVTVLGLDSHIQKTVSKIVATGIVFFWNFLSRKYWIYNSK